MTDGEQRQVIGALLGPVAAAAGAAVPLLAPPGLLDVLDAGLRPEVRRLAEHMRALFAPLGLSVRRYATLHHYDPSTVSRYLSGQRIPPVKFLDELLAAIAGLPHGAAVTPEVQQHTHALFLEALRVSNTAGYQLQVAVDRAHLAEIAARQAETTVQVLQEALAAREKRIHDLEMQNRELTAAWSADRSDTEAALELHQQRFDRMVDERHVLLDQIEQLRNELRRAMTARDKAVERAAAMESALAAIEADSAADLDEQGAPSQPPAPGNQGDGGSREQNAAATLDGAERTAHDITDDRLRALALAEIAKAAAGIDPDRAARLADAAQHIAEGITDGWGKALALAEVARVLADTRPERAGQPARDAEIVANPDRAESAAMRITDRRLRALALAEIARTVAGTDSDRAFRMASLAENTATGIVDHHLRALALAEIARTLASTHLDRAARLAWSAELAAEDIKDGDWKVVALAEIARALAGTGIEEHRNRIRPAEPDPGPPQAPGYPDPYTTSESEPGTTPSQSTRWTRRAGWSR